MKKANQATTAGEEEDAAVKDKKVTTSPEGEREDVEPPKQNGSSETSGHHHVARLPSSPDDLDDDDSSEEGEDDDLVLEGVLIRNPDVPSSSSSDDDDDDIISSESSDDDNEKEDDEEKKMAIIGTTNNTAPENNNPNKKRKSSSIRKTNKEQQVEHNKPNTKKKKSKNKANSTAAGEPEIVQVDFIFCDMDEKFFHGLKTHLASSSTIYASHSSAFADLMIENISVGTVISTEQDDDGNDDDGNNVYGFASVLNVTTYQSHACIQYLKQLCLKHCPESRKEEMEIVLSGGTRRPAGFLLHGRMINLPLEITHVLHEQLVLDMDWAVENAEGGQEERKSLDFGVFVRLAPTYPSSDGGGGPVVYKYFDDEVFATNAEFVYTFDAPKAYGTDEKQLCSVIVMTKTGHRAAMKDLEKLVNKR